MRVRKKLTCWGIEMNTLSLPTLRLPTLTTLFTAGAVAYLFALTGLSSHANSAQMMQMFIFFVFFYAAHSVASLFMTAVTTREVTTHTTIVSAMRMFRTATKVLVGLAVVHIILTAFFGLNLNSLFAEKLLVLKFTGVNLGLSNPAHFNYEYTKGLFLAAIVGYPVATFLVYGGLAYANKH